MLNIVRALTEVASRVIRKSASFHGLIAAALFAAGAVAVVVPSRLDAAERDAKRPFTPTADHTVKQVAGWKVYVNNRLLKQEPDLSKRALRLLEIKLEDILSVVPAGPVGELRKVPIWLGLDDGSAPCAEYHPNRNWLAEHGYNPDKAKCLEIGNARNFIAWSVQQPAMILHELAHAYHDQVLGFDDPSIREAYAVAKKSGSYEHVLRAGGKTERHYALTDHKEYFAEATEAYFRTNDFYPFVRAELHLHDPKIEAILTDVWMKTPARGERSARRATATKPAATSPAKAALKSDPPHADDR